MSGREEAFNASDEAAVEEAARGQRGREREIDRAIRRLLDSREGRLTLWWVVRDLSGWFERSYTGDAGTYFNEGRREVGTRVVERLMRVDTKAFGDLITEMTEGAK